MTKEEKTSDIYDICLERKSICCNRKMGEENCSKCKTYKMYKLGLAEGRKENEELKEKIESLTLAYTLTVDKSVVREKELEKEIDKLKDDYKKQRNRRIDELQKENAELKEQINQLSNDNHILKTSFILQQEQIAELEKQNKSLKDTLQAIATDTNEHITHNVAQNELDKWEL